ncbi:MAG: DUF1684 domain-containing protein [Phycisphaerales bacterium]|nr:DUF1684 domain-containing protein [Phycisphaerales bacterium]
MTPNTDLIVEHQAWVDTRERQLSDPDGWLALVGLVWLEPGVHRLGNEPPAELLFNGAAAGVAGTFEMSGSRVLFAPAKGVTATLDGQALEPGIAVELQDDQERSASVLRVGSLHITHINRHDQPALRIRDRNAPTLLEFRGMPRYPYDPAWTIPARFEPSKEDAVHEFEDVTGHREAQAIVGTLHFQLPGDLPGITRTLLAQAAGPRDLFVVFGDATNGQATYGGGRFLQVPGPDEHGSTVIDFNRAFTPPCSFTPYATCPIPPMPNRLDVPVAAGEQQHQSTRSETR